MPQKDYNLKDGGFFMKKKLLKAFILLVEFGLCFAAAMAFAYNYLYPYPNGYLDELERADEARYYKVVYKEKVDKHTLLYFSKSNNGVGNSVHFGTINSNMPDFIANFSCKSTSSVYLSCETVSYTITSDNVCYLFGATQDENTVAIDVTFYQSDDNKMTYEMTYSNQCFYYKGFDSQWAQYNCTITGYNQNGEATFEYYGSPFEMNQPSVIENN